MAGHDGKKQARSATAGRRLLVGMGAGAGVFLAAAAMATGSAVTAAPAHADFEELLDPIIQPILTSLTDSIGAFDPAAALDLTNWTDSLLSSLSSLDTALPAAAESAAASAASAEPAASSTTGTYDIPLAIAENTEPTVGATVDGASTTLLVDTGSSGLVIPLTDLDGGSTNLFTELETLSSLGTPTSSGVSGFGSVDYYYLTYNETVDYTTTTGTLETQNVPVEVEVFSLPTSLSTTQEIDELFSNTAFQDFDASNDTTGILGIGDNVGGGAGESPIEAAGFTGVTVDEPQHELIVENSNPGAAYATLNASGSTVSGLTEKVTDGSSVVGSGTVTDDIDSGGVYGEIPESIAPNGVPNGDTITVYDGSTPLYSYTVENAGGNQLPNEPPTVVSGSSIDSGYEAFENNPVYIDYSNDTLSYDGLLN
jgi:hypothetical protein